MSLLLHHEILDSELFELMHQNGDYTHFYFCYRWFLLDFKRGEKWVGLGIMAGAYNSSTPTLQQELSGVQGQCQLHSKTFKKKKKAMGLRSGSRRALFPYVSGILTSLLTVMSCPCPA